MVGVYEMDVFGEAAKSPEGFIEVDFLTGHTSGGTPSQKLAHALTLYRDALPELCQSQGVSVGDFRALSARYYFGSNASGRFLVTVEDQRGKRSTDEYVGFEGARPRVLDHLGRIRRV
jgi:hypothetical protein